MTGQLHVAPSRSDPDASCEVIARYRDLYPHVRVEVDEALSDLDLLQHVERGLLDLAFMNPLPAGPFESRLLLLDRWVHRAQSGSGFACCRRVA